MTMMMMMMSMMQICVAHRRSIQLYTVCEDRVIALKDVSVTESPLTLVTFPSLFTARPSYASAVLGVVILSICLSVRPSVRLSHACFVTNLKNLLAVFLYHMKGQSF